MWCQLDNLPTFDACGKASSLSILLIYICTDLLKTYNAVSTGVSFSFDTHSAAVAVIAVLPGWYRLPGQRKSITFLALLGHTYYAS